MLKHKGYIHAIIIIVLFVSGMGIHYFVKNKTPCSEAAEEVIELGLKAEGVNVDFDDLDKLNSKNQ